MYNINWSNVQIENIADLGNSQFQELHDELDKKAYTKQRHMAKIHKLKHEY